MGYSKFREKWFGRPDPRTPVTPEAIEHIEDGVARAHQAIDGRLGEVALNATYARATDLVSAFPGTAKGDSTTKGADLTNQAADRWTTLLATIVGETIENDGSSGSRADEIAARQGGRVFTGTIAGNTIPAAKTAVAVTGLDVNPVRGGEVASIAVTVAGVPGTLTRSGSDATFTRTAAGAAVPVLPRVDFQATDLVARGGNVQFIGAGTNDLPRIESGEATVDYVCAQYTAMTSALTPVRPRFIVWGPLDRGEAEGAATPRGKNIRAIEAHLAKTYGRLFVNVREYLSTRGLVDAGITPTAQDTADMAAGAVPVSLRAGANTVHLNAVGHWVMANLFARVLARLGWATIKAAVPNPYTPPTPDPGTFDPLSFGSDLIVWYDPHSGADGQTVTSLQDKSPNGFHAATVTGTPKYSATALNGTPAVTFEGTDKIYTGNLSGFPATVGVPVTVLVNGYHNGSGTGYLFDTSASNNLAIFRSSVSTTGFGARRSGVSVPLAQGVAGDVNPHSFVFVASGADGAFYLDGTQIAAGDTLTNSIGGAIAIGSQGGNTAPASALKGAVGDVVVIKRKLTADEIAAATKWLKSRRGVV